MEPRPPCHLSRARVYRNTASAAWSYLSPPLCLQCSKKPRAPTVRRECACLASSGI
jgi:hypothetical protein